ncbi:ABC transporter permease [Paenibacillus favisporus]|uniref:ABC transporter permease n=1 Tax=Paenibacillus favisporus TaxID=221028 RepID=UPI002DBB9FDD|nr:ABC transporter permease [Paenibacillus favisporus]MEC0176789.1 ABC transporter permease [Paenibacillus favisporus]
MMGRLAWNTVRAHKGIFAGTFLAAVLAIALITSSGLLMESALRGHSNASQYAGADAVIAADRNVTIEVEKGHKNKIKTKSKELKEGAPELPSDLTDRVGQIPGVKRAVMDWTFYAQPIDRNGNPVRGREGSAVLGHAWDASVLTPYSLKGGHEPSSGEVVLDSDLASKIGATLNDQVRIATAQGVESYRVSGIAAPEDLANPPSLGSLFFAAEDAVRMNDSEMPDAIGILAEPGTDRKSLLEALQREADGAKAAVYTGNNLAKADSPMGQVNYLGAVSLFGITGAVTVFAAIFVISGTVAFSVRQRLRELALLRTIGATPKQLRKMLSLETLILTIFASMIGCPAGIWIGRLLADQLLELGVIPEQFQLRVTLLPFAIAIAAGLIVTQMSVRITARRSVRIAPTQALRETIDDKEALNPVKLVLGVIFCAGGLAVLLFGPLSGGDGTGIGMAFIACTLFLVASTLLGPLLVKIAGGLVGSLIRTIGGVTGDLAASNTSVRASRMAGVALPLALLVALNGTMFLSNMLFDDIASDQGKARLTADYEVRAQGTPGLPLAIVSDIRSIPGVSAVTATVPVSIMIREGNNLRTYEGQGLESNNQDPAIELGVEKGDLRDLSNDAVAVSEELAESRQWNLGDRITMWLSDGTQAELRITAIYDLSRGLGDFLLPAQLAEKHGRNGMAGALYVRGLSGTDLSPDAFAKLRQQWPMANVVTREETIHSSASAVSSQQAAFYLMIGITILFTSIAVVNTFAIATSSRRSEFADLRLTGATFSQIRSMLRWESLVVTILGILIGCVILHTILGILGMAQAGVWQWTVDMRIYELLLAGSALLGLLANFIPARQAIRQLQKR